MRWWWLEPGHGSARCSALTADPYMHHQRCKNMARQDGFCRTHLKLANKPVPIDRVADVLRLLDSPEFHLAVKRRGSLPPTIWGFVSVVCQAVKDELEKRLGRPPAGKLPPAPSTRRQRSRQTGRASQKALQAVVRAARRKAESLPPPQAPGPPRRRPGAGKAPRRPKAR